MRRVVSALPLVFAALVSGATPLLAQDDGPKSGAWGVELGSAGSGSLLHFRSETSVALVGVYASYDRTVTEAGLPDVGAATDSRLNMQFRGGLRAYRGMDSRTRPFWSLLGIVGYDSGGNALGATFLFGAATEVGASYFFSPRVSMGASGALSATRRGAEAGYLRSEVTVSFEGLRLLGAIYF
jgi:hypothetical protein